MSGIDVVLIMILGMVISAGCIYLGVLIATRTGKHFVDTYVKKLTPDDMTKISQASREDVPEENLRALDIDDATYRKLMGWDRGPDISDGSFEEASY